ncbi:MAG: family 43 glycosylhydrolase [Eubacterium sp.]
MKKIISVFMSLCLSATAVLGFSSNALGADAYSNNNISRACVHDPSVYKGDDGKYYAVGSHIAMAESDDLINWSNTASSMEAYGDTPAENYFNTGDGWKNNLSGPLAYTTRLQKYALNKLSADEGELEYNCWAADVIYNEAMGKWCSYACCSVWGTTYSVIFLATADNPQGPFEYKDSIVYSGFSSYSGEIKNAKYASRINYNYTYTNITEALGEDYVNENIKDKKTGVFNSSYDYDCSLGAYPNAIDPTAFTDENGSMWLVYGSYSGGIYVIPLVEETGLADYDYMLSHSADGYNAYFGKQITKTNYETEGTGEGPFIVYDNQSGYYYLYLTYGGLAGDGGYNIREYRSKNPDGPYFDKAGSNALEQKNTGLKLMGNYKFSCQKTAMLSGGHSSSLIDDDGKMYQVYHQRFLADNGQGHQMRIHQMLRTKDGWAVMLPYEYQGEAVSEGGYSASQIIGTYEFVNHTASTQRAESGASLSTTVLPTQKIELAADGKIYCLKDYSYTTTNANTGSKAVAGAWKAEVGTYYASFVINGVNYSGVFCKQRDESAAGNSVMTFAAAGDNNAEIWGVQLNSNHIGTKTTTSKATVSGDGKIVQVCTGCGKAISTTVIPKASSVKLSATSYTYNGKVKTPSVTVKDSKGKTLKKNTDYTVSYAKGRKSVGKYAVKITFKGNYSGTKTLYFYVKPKATSISSVSAGSKKFTVKWKKQATQTTGYQIQYSTSSKFSKAKTVTVGKNSTTSKTVSKLSGKKKYYVRVRTYKTVGSTKYYSSWSKVKTVTTKK